MSKIAALLLTVISLIISIVVAAYHPHIEDWANFPTFFQVITLICFILFIVVSLASLFFFASRDMRKYVSSGKTVKPGKTPYFRIALNFVFAIVICSFLISLSVSTINRIRYQTAYTPNTALFGLNPSNLAVKCGLSKDSVKYYIKNGVALVNAYQDPKGNVFVQCPQSLGLGGFFPKTVKMPISKI